MPRFILIKDGQFADGKGSPCYTLAELIPEEGAYRKVSPPMHYEPAKELLGVREKGTL
jgi:hypothetical protein